MNKILWLFLLTAVSNKGVSQSCDEQNIKLQILGSGGPEVSDRKVSSSHLIWINDKARIMVDAGGGSAFHFEQSAANLNDLDMILLTHLHVDHSADLPEFIKGFYFSERQRNLRVMGPKGNKKMPDTTVFIDRLFGTDGAYRYLNSYLNPEKNSYFKIKTTDAPLDQHQINTIKIDDEVTIKSIAVNHGPISAVAWRVDVGNCSITFSGDMSNEYQSLARLAKNTDLLVANNVVKESVTGVGRWLHMPPSEIGKIARNAQAKKIMLAHFMRRSDSVKDVASEIIKKEYDGEVLLAEDMMIVDLKSQSKHHHSGLNESKQPVLNQGAKWQMDSHTRTMFQQMSQRVATGGDLIGLGEALNGDLQQLIQGCTMTGAAHDQLHVFLMPYMSAVKNLSEHGSKDAFQEVKHALDDYQNYFE
ncbi:MAG: MBL fold metallo-hydrolase [Marinicella sp.]